MNFGIIFITSELHYIRVVTSEGEMLILYNLYDAINELEDFYDGLQIHRSFWVVRDFINKIVKKNGTHQLQLINNIALPISRRRLDFVQNPLSKINDNLLMSIKK